MIAVDTNILVHAHQREASLHPAASALLRTLAEGRRPWAICFHALVEFYGVVTRPSLWRQPSTPSQALDQIAAWRESPSLRVLGDSPALWDQVAELAQAGQVRGPLIHDARMAATCLLAGVDELLSVDRDFSRFPALRVRSPLQS